MSSMWEKDKEFGSRIDLLFPLEEVSPPVGGVYERSNPFILWGVNLPGRKLETTFGDAEIVELEVEKMNGSRGIGIRETATTLSSAIVNKAKEATKKDFPAVVELRRVDSSYGTQALVLQYVSDYKPSSDDKPKTTAGGDDIPF